MKLNGHVFLKIMWFSDEFVLNWSKPHIPNIMNESSSGRFRQLNILNLASSIELISHTYVSFEGVFYIILADAN